MQGRRRGRLISLPVVVADYEGERYLVAMLGEDVNWVANVCAASALRFFGATSSSRLELALTSRPDAARTPATCMYEPMAAAVLTNHHHGDAETRRELVVRVPERTRAPPA
jgi:hypothetical protein